MKQKLFLSLGLIICLLGFSVGSVHAAACAQSGTTAAVTLTGTNCTMPSTLVGADGAASSTTTANTGTITIPVGTSITIGSGEKLVYGGSLSNNGSITKLSGGEIVKGSLWVTDADSDGYRLNNSSDVTFSVTQPGSKVRLGWTSGVDSNDASACPAGQTNGCTYCANGVSANVTAGTDPYSACNTANVACTNACVVSQRTGNCNGSGACAVSNVNVTALSYCTGAGTISIGQCQAGYTCNGTGHCCYTDIYGEHCSF